MKPKMWPRWGPESFLGEMSPRDFKMNVYPRDFKMKSKMWLSW